MSSATSVGTRDSLSPIFRHASEQDLQSASLVWRNFNGECRVDRPFHWVLAKPFYLRTDDRISAPWHYAVEIPQAPGMTVNADLTLKGANREKMVSCLGAGSSPERELQNWFDEWSRQIILAHSVRGLIAEFPGGIASQRFFDAFRRSLLEDCGISASGTLTLLGAQARTTHDSLSWTFDCHVRACEMPITFRLQMGLQTAAGKAAVPLGGSREEYVRSVQGLAEMYLREKTSLVDLGEPFGDHEKEIKDRIDQHLLERGLTTGWFTLEPVARQEIEVANSSEGEQWFEVAGGASASLSFVAGVKLVTGPSRELASPTNGESRSEARASFDPSLHLRRLITSGISGYLKRLKHKDLFLNWDRLADIRSALKDQIGRDIASSGFAVAKSIKVDLLHREWVEAFRKIQGEVADIGDEIPILPGNVPIDLKYRFRYRVMDVDENATQRMSTQGFPAAEAIKREIVEKFKSVSYRRTRETGDEPTNGVVDADVTSWINAELQYPGIGLVVRIEDLRRFPTQVELYRCERMIEGLTAQIDLEASIVKAYRDQRLEIEKEVVQLIGAGLATGEAMSTKKESLKQLTEEAGGAQRALDKMHKRLSRVQTHMNLLREAINRKEGIDPDIPVEENIEEVETED